MLGISRCVDDLGRVVIPKEIRNTLNIQCGTKVVIIPTEDGVMIKKDEQDLHSEIRAIINKYDMNCDDTGTIEKLKMIEQERELCM